MAQCLQGLRIALVAADGVGQAELDASGEAVRQAGAQTQLLSLRTGQIESLNRDLDPGRTYTVDQTVAEAAVDEYEALLMVPGMVKSHELSSEDAWSNSCVASSPPGSRSASSAMAPGRCWKQVWPGAEVSRRMSRRGPCDRQAPPYWMARRSRHRGCARSTAPLSRSSLASPGLMPSRQPAVCPGAAT